MRVGLFGGSFNPPHTGHQIIAETICERARLDAVWWIPASIPPHKQTAGIAPVDHRLAMTRLAAAGNGRFQVITIELERDGPSFTIDTLNALENQWPGYDFFLIVGGDSLEAFSSWREPEAIVKRVPLLVYPRENADLSHLPDVIAGRTQLFDVPKIGISSSGIRARYAAGESIRYLVPDSVRSYIIEHSLYSPVSPESPF